MECPYLDCAQKSLPARAQSCPTCQRLVKPCSQPSCGAFNRAFANFCRACGEALPEGQGDWQAFRGSPQRLGYNPSPHPAWPQLQFVEKLQVQLGDRCRSLLAYDRHLIAVAQSGALEIVDVDEPQTAIRLKADGPISCEPCVSRGLLFLGSPSALTAFSLGAFSRSQPSLEPLWQIRLSGTPIHALTALANRLYLTIFRQDGAREVQAVDDLDRLLRPTLRKVHSGTRLSFLAADQRLYFLSQEQDAVWLHTADPGKSPQAEITHKKIARAPRPFADHVPIAAQKGKLFGVFGDDDNLCRIDAGEAAFDRVLQSDAKAFSLLDHQTGVQIDTAGIVFFGANQVTDTLNPMERIKGFPILLGQSAAALAMQDGRIRVYDLVNPPRHEILRMSPDPTEITALISFRNCLAAGNARGMVKVYEVIDPGRPKPS